MVHLFVSSTTRDSIWSSWESRWSFVSLDMHGDWFSAIDHPLQAWRSWARAHTNLWPPGPVNVLVPRGEFQLELSKAMHEAFGICLLFTFFHIVFLTWRSQMSSGVFSLKILMEHMGRLIKDEIRTILSPITSPFFSECPFWKVINDATHALLF